MLILFFLLNLSLLNLHAIEPTSVDEGPTESSSASGKFWFYSQDPENLIYSSFKYKNEFFYEISFWFNLYATYRSSTIIFHDANDLRIIYDVFSADSLYKNDLNRFTKDALSQNLLTMRLQQMRDEFISLSKGKRDGPLAEKILGALRINKVKIPSNFLKAKKFFLALGDSMRYQIGQRDSVIAAIGKLAHHLSTIDRMLTLFKLPLDLRTISILESSFNLNAISSVGAAGVWQIIDSMATKFLIMNKNEDQRRNPIISSLAAFRILLENYRITKSWDFTLLAYNSGISHVLNFKKSTPLEIKKYLTTYSHDSFGFASKNYLFEFYSLNYALAYKKYLYTEVLALTSPVEGIFNIYISLCTFDSQKDTAFAFLTEDNSQFLNSIIRRGSAVISKTALPSIRFYRPSDNELLETYPNKFIDLIKNQSCSTK